MALQRKPSLSSVQVPNKGLVIVASRGQTAGIMLQAAHFSSMASKLSLDVLVRPDVVADDLRIL